MIAFAFYNFLRLWRLSRLSRFARLGRLDSLDNLGRYCNVEVIVPSDMVGNGEIVCVLTNSWLEISQICSAKQYESEAGTRYVNVLETLSPSTHNAAERLVYLGTSLSAS